MNKEELQDKLFISKDLNLYFYYYNNENDKIESKLIEPFESFFYLGDIIVIEEGFTLRNYFELVKKYELFQLLDFFFDCFIKEFDNCPKEGCKSPNIDYLILNRSIIYEGSNTINPSDTFNGIADLLKSEDGLIHIDKSIEHSIIFHGYDKDEDEFYGIEMSPLTELLDYEIVIDDVQLVIETKIFNDSYCEYNAKETNLTLFEFIKTIIWELSFHVCSDNRDSRREELEESAKQLEKEKNC